MTTAQENSVKLSNNGSNNQQSKIPLVLLVILVLLNLFVFYGLNDVRDIEDSLPLSVSTLTARHHNQNAQRRIYFITPTYDNLNQRADLVRLSNTLRFIDNLMWIVVEDAKTPSKTLKDYLDSTGIPYVLLAATNYTENLQGHRGLVQRNVALNYIEQILVNEKACPNEKQEGGLDANMRSNEHSGIIYFGDDDNAFDLRLFDVLRSIKRYAVFNVGLIGGTNFEEGFEGPITDEAGRIIGFNSGFKGRTYGIDMAGFAFTTEELCKHKFTLRFNMNWRSGKQEDKFLVRISPLVKDAEVPTKQVLTFHTKSLKNEQIKRYNPAWTGDVMAPLEEQLPLGQ